MITTRTPFTAVDMAYVYQEPCGCVTAIVAATVPNLTQELGRWKRYRPKGTILLVEQKQALDALNWGYNKGEHKHDH